MNIPYHTAMTERTDGDGMENTSLPSIDAYISSKDKGEVRKFSIPNPELKTSYNSKSIQEAQLIKLFCAAPIRKSPQAPDQKKKKGPKFVPCEPYKAAVRPMIPKKKCVMPAAAPLTVRERIPSCSSELSEISYQIDPHVKHESVVELSDELKKSRLDNEELERQLKMQVQINAELKGLLVAAVGEDIETRVHSLAEDKQHLAQKLINAAKTLSSHNEQVEWLASQCEVWRSKFLASSVMVEELARWKASLSQKIIEEEAAIKRLLEERKFVRKHLHLLYSNLDALRANFDLLSKRSAPKTCNVIDLSCECSGISQGLIIQLLGAVPPKSVENKLQGLDHYTDAEKNADYILKHPYLLSLVGEPDAACNAVLGAAVALSSQLYHQNNPPRIECCAKCTGQIKLV